MSVDHTSRKNAKTTRGRPFEKGNAGRPKGARHKTTLAVEALLQGEADALSRKAVAMALAGDTTALKLCIDRIAPIRKSAPSAFDLPEVTSPKDLPDALCAVLRGVAAGELSVDEGKSATEMLEAVRRAYESADLASRIEKLEARHG